MAAKPAPLDITHNPVLREVVEAVVRSGEARSLALDQRIVATLVPATGDAFQARPVHRSKARNNAWLRSLIGAAAGPDDGVHDVAERHDEYLARVYLDRHQADD
jgi:hypothetical protein